MRYQVLIPIEEDQLFLSSRQTQWRFQTPLELLFHVELVGSHHLQSNGNLSIMAKVYQTWQVLEWLELMAV
jgi:hypothetical protein